MLIRKFSGWSEGVMWAVLIMNIFASLMDIGVKEWKTRKKAVES
jgi:Na+-translocating ferredoxin:NAD+ oxidoreductase RnfD subunit